MGGLVPNPNDMEVITALNGVFSEPRLTALRAWRDAHDPNFFAAGRRLHRIAYRLNIHPTAGANPRGKWFKFLKSYLKERPNGVGGSKNHDIILAAIDGLLMIRPTVLASVFGHVMVRGQNFRPESITERS
jgi:hypothetical protein